MIVDRGDKRYVSDEICPHCESIIYTDGAFQKHICPNCDSEILPCNVCKDPVKNCRILCPVINGVKIIGTFDGKWDRTGIITVSNNRCCICKNNKEVLGIDNSAEEYNTGYICLNCIKKGMKTL